ncbi:MAG: M2 family metallopeptidase [Deltaproteobacteria bacterium]|nr:M2 family metallopeptidase [Deltaproteobacteria bacterium]
MKHLVPSTLLVAALLAVFPASAHGEAPTHAATPGAAAATAATTATTMAPSATPADAKAFVKKVNEDLKKLYTDAARADWVKNTYITDDTEVLSADAAEKVMVYVAAAIKDATRFNGLALDADTARALHLLKISADLPAPNDAAKTAELARIASQMTSLYGKGKHCKKGKDGKEECRDLEQLTNVMQKSRDWNELLDAWNGWHTVSPPIQPLFQKYVALVNEGSKNLGFDDDGALWKSRYDMSPAQFEGEMERLWGQVKPLYEDVHCYVRGKLAQKYAGKMKDEGAIPAHLLGNMWAQEWANIYDTVEPYPGEASLDVTAALKAQGIDELRLAKMGEEFFVNLGLKKLPETFWTRSMLVKPKDREVVCHASAWDVTSNNDVRIKMCIQVDEDNLITIHHELGHIYYYQYYYDKPVLFQQGAHDGFHEAIGDAVALSVNPTYLQKIGVLKGVPSNEKALINLQLKDALDKVAFLPFGYLMDKWRWDVFNGKTKPADYNKSWWQLRRQYQGIEPAGARPANAFDPGAKYHIPANVPYARYFLARILQFQFHKSLCDAAGHKGPLHTCSVAGNKAAGKKLSEMLAMGASKPWPEAMKKLTGTEQMDGGALIAYFEPLSKWLKDQNKGRKCGW